MKDKHQWNPLPSQRFETTVHYVDWDKHRILVRSKDKQEAHLDYDVLLGCDGIRSVVREALAKQHHDFELEVSGIFQNFRVVHVKRPDCVSANSMHTLPNIYPNMQGLVFSQTDGNSNISIRAGRLHFDKLPEEIKSYGPELETIGRLSRW